MPARIAVDELRVGMFVHLDLRWWAHPFALSSFKLTSADQIATIRGLGLTQVRWSPEKSTLDGDAAPPAAAVNDDAAAEPAQEEEPGQGAAAQAAAPDAAPQPCAGACL